MTKNNNQTGPNANELKRATLNLKEPSEAPNSNPSVKIFEMIDPYPETYESQLSGNITLDEVRYSDLSNSEEQALYNYHL